MNQQQRTTAITLTTLVLIIWAGIGALLWRALSTPPSETTTIANNVAPTASPTSLANGIEKQPNIGLSKANPTATLFPRITAQPTNTPEPTPTHTLQPTNTPKPTNTPTALATVTPTSTATLAPTASPTPTQIIPTATATPEPKSALTITDLLALLLPGSSDTITIVEDETPVAAQISHSPESNERYLLVDQDQQMMVVYENGGPVRNIPVSTGRPVTNSFTPAWEGAVGAYWGGGPFRDSDFLSDYMWYLFPGDGGSILIHSLPYTLNGEQKVYDRPDALGVEPASRGCVRISPEDAAWLRQWNPVDVAIKITPWSGKIHPADIAQVEIEISQLP